MSNMYPDGYITGFHSRFFLDISEDMQDLEKQPPTISKSLRTTEIITYRIILHIKLIFDSP